MKNILWVSFLTGILVFSPDSTRAASEDYWNDAQKYMDSGEYQAALIQLKNLLKISPDDGEARFLLGTAYLQLNDGESAIKEFHRAQALGVSRERWIVPLARAYLLAGKPRELLEEIHPDTGVSESVRADIYAVLAMAELALKNFAEAERDLQEALGLDGESVEVLIAAARVAAAKRDYSSAAIHARRAAEINGNVADVWMILGEVERAEGNNQAALKNFNKALAINPDYLPARLARASVYIALRDFDSAEKDIRQVRTAVGDVPMALYLQGAVDFERHSYAAAADSLNKVVTAIPDHWPSLLLLGTIAYHENQLETAYTHLSRFVNAVPDYVPAVKLLAATALKLKDSNEAIELIQAARTKLQEDDPQLLALLGSAYIEKGEYDKATELLSKAVEISPDAAAIRTQLALSYLGTGSFDQAVGELQTAVDLGSDVSQADIILMLALLRQKKFDDAIESGINLMKRRPDDPVPVNLTGVAYYSKGDKDSARKYWRKALEIKQDFFAAATNLAKLEASDDRYEAAAGWYRQILQNQPGNINALLGLAELAKIQGNHEEAAKWLETAVNENPDDIRHQSLLIDYLLSQQDFKRAKKVIDALKKDSPDDIRVIGKSGMVYLAIGEYDSAVAAFQQLVRAQPKNPEYHFLLGQAWLKAGSPEKAKAEWRESLKLKSYFIPAISSLVQLASKEKKYDEALDLARQYQSKFPKKIFGYQLEGDVLYQQGDYQDALSAYQRGFEEGKESSLAQRIFATGRLLGDKVDSYKKMLAWLEKNPDDFGSRLLLGSAYLEDGETGPAIQVYEQLFEIQPLNVVVLNNLAWLYQQTGDSRALKLAEKALEVGRNDPEVVDTVGWIFLLNGQIERSLPLLERAASQAPQIDAIQLHYAQALLKAGRKSEAAEQLRKLLAGDRDFPERVEAENLMKSI